ncbi:MAG: hypothetical protein FJ090_20155 [Deltaproteobacteria bacterium]|nr:hypothetical protein [Deltaproteobacteria bacterium]
MAVRSASRRYPSLRAFVEDYQGMLRIGALTLPPGTIDGPPMAEMKIDLVIPVVGRLGPVDAQLLQQLPDGTVALRVSEWPADVTRGFNAVFAAIDEMKQWFVESGQLQAPSDGRAEKQLLAEVERLRARVRALESRPDAATSAAPAADGPTVVYDEQGKRVVERGFRVPDVSGLEPALSGTLADRSFRDACMELAIARATGLLTLELPDGRLRWGFWQKGGPVGWRAEPLVEDEVLGILLYRAGQLNRQQLEQSLNLMEQNGVRQGEALIEMGVVSFAQLVMLLQKQSEFVFQRVVKDREGKWSFHVLEELPERFVTPPLRTPSLLFRALRNSVRDMPAEDLATTLRPWLDRYVYFVDGAARIFDEMKLNSEEAGFLKIVGSTSYRLRELFAVSNLSRSATAGMIWSLADLHLVEFRDAEAQARGLERVTRVLEDRKRAVMRGTLFEALDLHWICTAPEVEAAWRKLSPEFAPDSMARWGEANKQLVNDIYGKLTSAYETLKVDSRRRDYRAEIMERMQIEQSAEMLAKKGEMAFMKQSQREAFDCFSKALELVPNSAEYRDGLSKALSVAKA